MENKTNISAIELYSRKVLKPLLDEHFTGISLTGSQILSYSRIEQVNFFTLQLLFEKWKEETSKLESPYFDFHNEQVKDALQTFMNTLSQFILVKKEDFSPLLLQSVFNTIFCAIAPIPFLEQKFVASDKTYTTEDLKNLLKYIRIHGKLTEFLKNVVGNQESKSGKQIIQALKTEFGEGYTNEEEANGILSLFNDLLPVQLTDFQYQEPVNVATPLEEPSKPLSLNEMTSKVQKTTTLNLHTKNKILDIRAAMNINQRFMFIKELFKGNEQVFQQAMDLANHAENYEKAVNTLIDNYAQKYNWEIDSEQVNELFDLVGRKFYPEAF